MLNAAAACPVFDRRSLRAHYRRPPAQLVFTLAQRALELASLQPWCRNNAQRARLLCRSCPLSTLAFRMCRAFNRRASNRSFEVGAMAHVMKRCFGILAWRLWTGFKRGRAASKSDVGDGIIWIEYEYSSDDAHDDDNSEIVTACKARTSPKAKGKNQKSKMKNEKAKALALLAPTLNLPISNSTSSVHEPAAGNICCGLSPRTLD